MGQFLIDDNIDWNKLKNQKLSLLHAIDVFECEGKKTTAEDLEGILNLLDNVQDNAVKSGKWTEQEIFNLEGEDE